MQTSQKGATRSWLEKIDIDFTVSGLSHAVVKQAENSRVRELVKKIESHPHRQDLQADLQQSNAYNPFSEKSKKMVRDMGNVELFESCETIPKVQHVNQLKKKCEKTFFQGIHDRFIRDPEFRNRMIEKNRDEDLCQRWDALADEDHTYHLTPQEYSFYKSNWWLRSNKQGSNTVRTTHRSDFKKALSTLQQLKQKEEGALQTPTDSHRNQKWAQSSSSWWNWQGSWWTPYSYESHDEDETK